MKRIVHYLLLGIAWLSCALGFVGIFVPVLPTTPLLLLATFLFARESPRCHAWIANTRMYRAYVVPFREAGGIDLKTKVRILAVSITVIGISAFLVQKPVVWVVLGCVVLFLLYLMLVRIPTITPEEVQAVRKLEQAKAE